MLAIILRPLRGDIDEKNTNPAAPARKVFDPPLTIHTILHFFLPKRKASKYFVVAFHTTPLQLWQAWRWFFFGSTAARSLNEVPPLNPSLSQQVVVVTENLDVAWPRKLKVIEEMSDLLFG